jgi:hypothetical protein
MPQRRREQSLIVMRIVGLGVEALPMEELDQVD